MRCITKGPQPGCLTSLQADPNRTTWSLYADESALIREALCVEQGHLCAYCQSRIHPTGQAMKIEHWAARNVAPELIFQWDNLLGVCPGESDRGRSRAAHDRFHCDTYRGNLPTSEQALNTHPARLTPGRFRYQLEQNRVRICGEDADAERDITRLNLNHPRLCENRSAALQMLKRELERQGWGPAKLQEKRRALARVNHRGELREFVEVLDAYIARKLKQHGA